LTRVNIASPTCGGPPIPRGEIAIGIRWAGQDQGGGVQLDPRRDEHLELHENDERIVLATDE
jgi:hypothetical protein